MRGISLQLSASFNLFSQLLLNVWLRISIWCFLKFIKNACPNEIFYYFTERFYYLLKSYYFRLACLRFPSYQFGSFAKCRTLKFYSYRYFNIYLRPVWLNGWVFFNELSGCAFESRCCHLNLRYRTCFEKGVPWHSGNYRAQIHSETRTWHNKKIQSGISLIKLILIWIRWINHSFKLMKHAWC